MPLVCDIMVSLWVGRVLEGTSGSQAIHHSPNQLVCMGAAPLRWRSACRMLTKEKLRDKTCRREHSGSARPSGMECLSRVVLGGAQQSSLVVRSWSLVIQCSA